MDSARDGEILTDGDRPGVDRLIAYLGGAKAKGNIGLVGSHERIPPRGILVPKDRRSIRWPRAAQWVYRRFCDHKNGHLVPPIDRQVKVEELVTCEVEG